MISLDCETTGINPFHAARPYFVTTCDEEMNQVWWEWDVNPYDRMPIIPQEDIDSIQELINTSDKLVLQNGKFDCLMLNRIGITQWDWSKVYDTLIAGHLLRSNTPHNLTDMVLQYLRIDIEKYEKNLKDCCNEARKITKKEFPDWLIAKEGVEGMPSAKGSCWKYDTWLPKAIARELNYSESHRFWSIARDYANMDTASTMLLWKKQRELLESKKLWKIFECRMKCLRVANLMEMKGITLSGHRLKQSEKEYKEESATAGRTCINIAKSYQVVCEECKPGPENPLFDKTDLFTYRMYSSDCPICKNTRRVPYDLSLPKSGNNGSLNTFIFDVMNLPQLKRSDKTGKPSLDKSVLEHYEVNLPENSKQLLFIKSLKAKRKRDTAIAYMEGYRRYWLPYNPSNANDWYILHPTLNPTGTDTLRWSSQTPNEQNVSHQEGFNLRYAFGPAPNREWWSCDAQNIELRIPAYAADERKMINLFERPDDPPYFGSNHLVVSHLLHKKKFEECVNDKGEIDGRIFKKKYKDTLYQWCKNGSFAVQYGAIEASGTADRAYHVKGGQRIVENHFTNMKALNQSKIDEAERFGYVLTIPDKTVDPERGYPIYCTRTDYGKILPTVPLNYFVQSTACWWMMKAMIRCQEYLDELNNKKFRNSPNKYYLIMQIHDEMVFDFPKGVGEEPWKTNLPIIREIQRLMSLGGNDIGVPTPVSCTYHPDNWSEGKDL